MNFNRNVKSTLLFMLNEFVGTALMFLGILSVVLSIIGLHGHGKFLICCGSIFLGMAIGGALLYVGLSMVKLAQRINRQYIKRLPNTDY